MVANCQVQSIGTGTVVSVDVFVNVCSSLGISTIVPCERFAGILVVNIVGAVVDCKIEGVGVCAGRAWLGMTEGVDATFSIILVIPIVGVAGCDVVGGIVVVTNCHVQGICAGAVVGIEVIICVCTRLGVSAVVPCKVFAGFLVV